MYHSICKPQIWGDPWYRELPCGLTNHILPRDTLKYHIAIITVLYYLAISQLFGLIFKYIPANIYPWKSQ